MEMQTVSAHTTPATHIEQKLPPRLESIAIRQWIHSSATMVIREVDRNQMVFLRSGMLAVFSGENAEHFLCIAGPGDVVGLSSLLHNLPCKLTALAFDETDAAIIDGHDLTQIVGDCDKTREWLLRSIVQECNASVTSKMRLADSEGPFQRVANLLLECARKASVGRTGHHLQFRLPANAVAGLAACTALPYEITRRKLWSLSKEGLIRLDGVYGKQIVTVLNEAQLNHRQIKRDRYVRKLGGSVPNAFAERRIAISI